MAGTKLHIVSCFALFALLVAPFAWQQTQVQRVELPATRIQALSWNASRFAAAPRHVVRVISFGKDASAHETATQAALQKLQSPRVQFVYENKKLNEQELTQLQKLAPQALDDALLELAATSDNAFTVLLLCNKGDHASTITVGKHRHAWSQACSLQDAQFTRALQTLLKNHVYPQDGEVSKTGRARIAVKYRLQFSLLKETAESAWTWDFQSLEQRFLAPVLEKLESVAQFTVEHQTLHYARIAKEIHADSSGDFHFVHAEDLKRFKSTNDFLTSSVLSDREQVLHFMAALPSQQHTPLFIKPAHGETDSRLATAFEIPSWGVVALLDPRTLESSSAAELQRVMGLFVAELRTLLGLPSFVKRQRETRDLGLAIQFLPSPRDGVAQWELDVIVRSLLPRHVRASIETLQSIVQLVGDMPQMSVLDRVAQRISHALELVERMLCVAQTSPTASQCELLSAAMLLPLAREAVEEADAAYYDHTMIRQLYFPQEQMLGVFAPLLAPLLLPFFFGWIREFRQLRAKRKAQKAKAE